MGSNASQSNALMYLSYGNGPHVQEIIFSILSIHRWVDPHSAGIELLVYTDTPDAFDGLGVTIVPLDEAVLREWSGPKNYAHRRKLEALRHSLSRKSGKVAMIDGDTWFRRSPVKLFERVDAGRACLHICEYRLGHHADPQSRAFADLLAGHDWYDADGHAVVIGQNPAMWNSGVIGIHSADAACVDSALHMLDQLGEVAAGAHYIEQYAVGQSLERLELRETADIVFHYWPSHLRAPFKKRIFDVLAQGEGQPLPERAQLAYAHRPRATLVSAIKMQAKAILHHAGLPSGGPRASG